MAHFDYGYFQSNKKKVVSKKNKIISSNRTVINRVIANRFDHEFYDGDRINGYGGFKYDGRWKVFLKKIIKKYNLNKKSKVLDLGAKKGFFMYDLEKLIPGIKVLGIEDHKYAIKHSLPSVKNKIKLVNSYCDIKYKKKYFDFVHAHNSIYRYSLKDLIKIIQIFILYIEKITHNDSYIRNR